MLPTSTNRFDEANYLARYPDVANAVKQGLFKSGFHHYQVYGIHEKRETANVAEATPRPNGAGTVLSTRKASAFMKIRIIMMLKNEDDLALPWIKYHGSLVGYENLIVLDNGSTKERTLSALKWGAERGAKVDYQYSTQAEYVKRGSTYVDIIQRMDAKDPADFYIPLDCDEFLSVERDGRVNCSHRALAEELSSYVKCPNPLVIHAGLDNHPHKAGFFRWSPGQRKTFFAEGACAVLDHGFHVGRSRLGLDRIRTKIVYIHYHYKPYDLLVEHSKQKLEPFTTDFSEENMKKYLNDKKFCYHSAYYILKSREDYATAFNDTAFIEFPEIRRQFELLGERLPFA